MTGGFPDATFGFTAADFLRRAQGATLDVTGLGPTECPYHIVGSNQGWRLRSYLGSGDGPTMLIVSAPIKRPYIWDLAPSVSAIGACIRRGFRVFLIEWIAPREPEHGRGLIEYADDIGKNVVCVSEAGGLRPFLMGHSLGGTLAAIYAASEPGSIEGLILLGSPLCFGPGVSRFRDALVALTSGTRVGAGPIPGSLLSQLSALASPEEFVWARAIDATLSLFDRRAAELHIRIERWALDEVSLSGKLAGQTLQWLYREDRFYRTLLTVGDKVIGPLSLRSPTLAVVNSEDRIVPPEAVTPFLDAMPLGSARLLLYSGDVGVCLQHVAVLAGRRAHQRVWPAIVSWMNRHQEIRKSTR